MQLCPECAQKCHDRIEAAITHNQERDVDWWVKWWGPELERQKKAMEAHCNRSAIKKKPPTER